MTKKRQKNDNGIYIKVKKPEPNLKKLLTHFIADAAQYEYQSREYKKQRQYYFIAGLTVATIIYSTLILCK